MRTEAQSKPVSQRFPRVFYFLVELVLPLLLLIGLSFLFGWILASAESPGEVAANDDLIRDSYRQFVDYQEDRSQVLLAANVCLETNFSDETEKLYVNQCITNQTAEVFPEYDFEAFADNVLGGFALSFEWTKCDKLGLNISDETEQALGPELVEIIRKSDQYGQAQRFVIDFFQDWQVLRQSENDTTISTIELATGSKSCRPHTAAGALFWFTIMTTIGYGNVAPSSDLGRYLIFTAGFGSVIGFLYLNASASHVLGTLVEDVLIRLRLRRLTRGLPACIVWLVLLVGWVFSLAGVAIRWTKDKTGSNFDFKDATWFSYITITTIGLGDYNIPHQDFEARDMFYVPLCILCGFVILGIFAAKLVDTVTVWFPRGYGAFERILQETQPKEEDESTQTERFLKEQVKLDKDRAAKKHRIGRRNSF